MVLMPDTAAKDVALSKLNRNEANDFSFEPALARDSLLWVDPINEWLADLLSENLMLHSDHYDVLFHDLKISNLCMHE